MKQDINNRAGVLVEMETNMGKMVLVLYDDTPVHRDNFLKLVNEHFYDSLLFHRVIKGFMIQGGDPESRHARPGQMLGGGTIGLTLPAEFREWRFHRKGALCAARLGDNVNPEKRSSACQFYIVQGRKWNMDELKQMEQRMGKQFPEEVRQVYCTEGGTPHLDGDYTVFGQVIEGMEVIDAIAATPTGPGDRPEKDVVILGVRLRK